jgi:peptide/nickel transport system substrate-binding protein
MKRGSLFKRLVILMIILCVPFAAVAMGEKDTGTAAAAAADEPQYGGTFTQWMDVEPKSWDQWDAYGAMCQLHALHLGQLLNGDVEKYGPRGTNDFPFTLAEHMPDQYLAPQLAESWELTSNPLGVKFKIRQGVMWTGNERIGMKPREYTAYDAEKFFNRFQESGQGPKRIPFMKKPGFKALDNYTLQTYFDTFAGGWPVSFGYGWNTWNVPQEVVDAGAADWRNHTSIGPFVLKEYVKGSHISWEKHPDWWNKERTIDGKSYDLPFVDNVVFPIIIDESTQIASLRTGKVDMADGVPLVYKDTLSKTSKDLIIREYAGGGADYVTFNFFEGPTSELEVRRALMIGTDMEAIAKTVHTRADIHCVPFNAGIPIDIYTPIADLPPDAKELFTYDPEKAKKLIADAGFPNGFTITMKYSATAAGGRYNQIAALLEDMWAKIGVTLKLNPMENALFQQQYAKGDYGNTVLKSGGNGKPAGMDLYKERALPSMLLANDDYYKDTLDKASATMDPVQRNKMLKDLGVYYLSTVSRLPVGNPYYLNVWWPWVKNYYGEIDCGVGTNKMPIISSLWIDQNLKKSMGY